MQVGVLGLTNERVATLCYAIYLRTFIFLCKVRFFMENYMPDIE